MAGKRTKKSIVLIYFILVAALITIVYILPGLTNTMKQTVTAEYGDLEVAEDLTGYIVRNEAVYYTAKGGDTEYIIEEGTRVRKGVRVMSVSGEAKAGDIDKLNSEFKKLGDAAVKSKTLRAGRNGVVSYYMDGYEGALQTKNIDEISKSDFSVLGDSTVSLKSKKLAAMEPAFKIYDNAKWYILLWVSDTVAEKYTKGAEVTVRFEDGEVTAKVFKIQKKGGKDKIILQSNMHYTRLPQIRVERVRVITQSSKGLIIDNSCITEEDGVSGVYVQDKVGDYSFVPVKVLMSNDKQSVISESVFYDENEEQVLTVDLYDEVLRKP